MNYIAWHQEIVTHMRSGWTLDRPLICEHCGEELFFIDEGDYLVVSRCECAEEDINQAEHDAWERGWGQGNSRGRFEGERRGIEDGRRIGYDEGRRECNRGRY